MLLQNIGVYTHTHTHAWWATIFPLYGWIDFIKEFCCLTIIVRCSSIQHPQSTIFIDMPYSKHFCIFVICWPKTLSAHRHRIRARMQTSTFGSISFVWPSIQNYMIAFRFCFLTHFSLLHFAAYPHHVADQNHSHLIFSVVWFDGAGTRCLQLKITIWNANNFQFSYNANNKSINLLTQS